MHLPFTKEIALPTPILATKSYIPHTRLNLAPRPRLIKRLDESLGPGGKLTFTSVPAGFGKMIGATDRSHQEAKRRTMNAECYEVLAPHASFPGDKI
jgi:hypothetical protein